MQTADGALHLPAIGSILIAIRPHQEGCLSVGYFGCRVRGSMKNWSYTYTNEREKAKILDCCLTCRARNKLSVENNIKYRNDSEQA